MGTGTGAAAGVILRLLVPTRCCRCGAPPCKECPGACKDCAGGSAPAHAKWEFRAALKVLQAMQLTLQARHAADIGGDRRRFCSASGP
jgi:hypothetical protein